MTKINDGVQKFDTTAAAARYASSFFFLSLLRGICKARQSHKHIKPYDRELFIFFFSRYGELKWTKQ